MKIQIQIQIQSFEYKLKNKYKYKYKVLNTNENTNTNTNTKVDVQDGMIRWMVEGLTNQIISCMRQSFLYNIFLCHAFYPKSPILKPFLL